MNNLDEITPQEVPMDGSVSLFPQNDYSAIYAKTWTKDGTIATVKFIPEQSQAVPQKSPIEERLDKIDQRFDRLEKMLSNDCDGKIVPIFWNHQHDSVDNVLGHGMLEAITFSWECETTPVSVTGHEPTAHIEIDSKDYKKLI